jgi:spore coat protein U-like protein
MDQQRRPRSTGQPGGGSSAWRQRWLRWLRGALVAGLLAGMVFPRGASAVPVCSIDVSSDVVFGVYDVFALAPLTTTVALRMSCPRGATVTISKGNAPTYDPRLMSNGTDVLQYNLFLDPGYASIWGDGTGGTRSYITATGNARATIYARIPAGQEVTPGVYSDSLVVTVFP